MLGRRGSLSVLLGALALVAVLPSPAASATTGVATVNAGAVSFAHGIVPGPPTGPVASGATPSAAVPAVAPTLAVAPSTGLVDGQTVSVVSTGTTPGSTFVFAECDPIALQIFAGQLPPEDNPDDGCDAQRDAVLFSDAAGVVAGTLDVEAVLATAAGPADCRATQCFVALFALAGGPSVQVDSLTFSATACGAPGSCSVPADWAGSSSARVAASPAATATPVASRSHAVTLTLDAGPAGPLLGAPGTVGGPWSGSSLASPASSAPPVTGEGLVQLALAAPGTAWGLSAPRAAVVDVAVDGGPSQQLVLFDGATPFVYAGFTGPLTTGPHTVTVSPDAALSVMGGHALHVEVLSAGLRVVTPDNPEYLAYAYAPVMYGRSTSTLHDTPLVDYAGSTPEPGGATRLSYTVVWSHEDAGTGFVPWLELGSWGRLTDIENAISFTVAADGTVSDASYLWGGVPPGYPDTEGAASETDVAFAGSYWGHHPILRDATGNNDFSDQGTTAFRFQQAPVAPPGPGQPREAVMDANPWTYRVMGQEMDRWYTDVSADPASPQPGDARQYAYVQLSTAGTGVSSVAVDLQLAGSSTWYESDLGSGYPLVGTGTLRTVVKLPTGWTSQAVTGVRLRVFPASAAPSVAVAGVVVHALSPTWVLSTVALPAPTVLGGTVSLPPSLQLTASAPRLRVTGPGGVLSSFQVTVVDHLGRRLAGVPVTFATRAGPGVSFAGCGCATVATVTDTDGTAGSGPAQAGDGAGTTTLAASSVDPLAPPATFTVRVAASHAA